MEENIKNVFQSAEKNQSSTNGKELAHAFKFYAQEFESRRCFSIPYNRVPFIVFYKKNSKIFDNLATICNKYDIDYKDFIKWCVKKQHITVKQIKDALLNIHTFFEYFTYVKIKEEKHNIFKRYDKCANNIAVECINNNYSKVVDYIQHLINSKKLAQYYVGGKISKYFFAAIPRFKDIILKLDKMSKDEFHQIYVNYDKYHQDIYEAMKQELGYTIGPFSYVNKIIESKKSSII